MSGYGREKIHNQSSRGQRLAFSENWREHAPSWRAMGGNPRRVKVRLQQGHCGCHALGNAANLKSQDTGTRDFDGHRDDGDQRSGTQFRSEKLKCREHAIADDRYVKCARRGRAQKNETRELLAIGRTEGLKITVTKDV